MSRSSPRDLGKRTCRKCRERKPLEEFEGKSRHCPTCLEARIPVLTKTQRNRCRNKAYVELMRRHKEEYDEIYRQEMELMRNEAGYAEMLAGMR